MHFWRNGSITPYKMFYLIILWTGCLLVSAITEHPVVSAGESGCRLENGTVGTHEGVKAYCSHLSLTTIPRDLPPNTITLDASFNNITALQNDSFTSLRQLITLNVVRNLISYLEVGTFSPLTKLQQLIMTKNKLTHLPPNIFASNQFLSTLVLSDNNLSSVPTETLTTLHRLEKIFLTGNSIRIADFKAFTYMNNISVIDISENQIFSVRALTFKPLRNASLKKLNLSKNKLHVLPQRLFSYIKEVEHLIMASNRLQKLYLSSFLSNMKVGLLTLDACGAGYIIPLDNSTLFNSSFPKIHSVNINQNAIASIPSYAFLGFNQTRTLDMSANKITSLVIDSFCGLDSLTHLDISHNHIMSLDSGMFSCNLQLQELFISNNKILLLNPMSFHGLFALRKLDLSYNLLSEKEGGNQWNNPALTFINISHNSLKYMNRDLLRGILANLHILDVSYNNLKSYSPLTFNNVPSLRVLYLIYVERQYLYRVFSEMKNLIKLDISFAETTLNSTRQFTETRSLEQLRMCQNNLKATDLFDNRTQSSLFDGLVSLKRLNLYGNSLNNMEPGVFRSLNKLNALDLSKASIVILQPQIFKGLVSLRTLYLNENNILTTSAQVLSGLDNLGSLYFENSELEFLDKNTFLNTSNLRNLFLSGNQLTNIQNDTFFPTNHTLTLDVSANPFSCTCELSWFITWLNESNINLKHPNQTICSRTSIKEVVNLRILMFDPADFCFVNSVDSVNILLIVALSFFGVMVGFVSILAYSKRWWLNHKLFLLKLAIIGYQEMAEEFIADNYEFHLNLMFHEAEEEWVDQVLKPGLEERLPHLQNIIYGDKDLHLGMYYVNAIFDAIDNSFKTVLLISNQSIDDPWCMTKLRMSLEHLNDTGLDKVILIFLEDIDDDHLPYLVRLFMSRNKPYMLWTENEDGQKLFWAQFEKSMRANRAINNIIPV